MKTILAAALASVSLLAMAPAMAADLIIDEEMASPGVVDVGGNWEGVFIGGFVGGASGTYDADEDAYSLDDMDVGVTGWLVGVNAGANFYIADGIVAGIVGDVAWADISGGIYNDQYTYQIDWQGSLRGRLGLDAGAFMPYLTAGVAFAHGSFDWDFQSISDDVTHIGWTVGAGVELAVTEDLSIDALYRYSNYGDATYFADTPGVSDASLDTHQVTVGLNWKF